MSHQVVAAVDINTTANDVYRHNFPSTALLNKTIEVCVCWRRRRGMSGGEGGGLMCTRMLVSVVISSITQPHQQLFHHFSLLMFKYGSACVHEGRGCAHLSDVLFQGITLEEFNNLSFDVVLMSPPCQPFTR